MENIFDLANEYGKDFIGIHSGYEACAEEEDVVNAFLCGAKAQQTIDIEKACQTMESLMYFYGVDRDIMFRISKDVRKKMEE